MKFSSPAADVYVPDRRPLAAALARTTHLCLAAHQDDIEILAYHGISAGYTRRTFTGVVITDGGGSPRTGKFAKFSNEEMKAVRRAEQRRAARIGRVAHRGDHAQVPAREPAAVDVDRALGVTERQPRAVAPHERVGRRREHDQRAAGELPVVGQRGRDLGALEEAVADRSRELPHRRVVRREHEPGPVGGGGVDAAGGHQLLRAECSGEERHEEHRGGHGRGW